MGAKNLEGRIFHRLKSSVHLTFHLPPAMPPKKKKSHADHMRELMGETAAAEVTAAPDDGIDVAGVSTVPPIDESTLSRLIALSGGGEEPAAPPPKRKEGKQTHAEMIAEMQAEEHAAKARVAAAAPKRSVITVVRPKPTPNIHPETTSSASNDTHLNGWVSPQTRRRNEAAAKVKAKGTTGRFLHLQARGRNTSQEDPYKEPENAATTLLDRFHGQLSVHADGDEVSAPAVDHANLTQLKASAAIPQWKKDLVAKRKGSAEESGAAAAAVPHADGTVGGGGPPVVNALPATDESTAAAAVVAPAPTQPTPIPNHVQEHADNHSYAFGVVLKSSPAKSKPDAPAIAVNKVKCSCRRTVCICKP
jgi:hypothetical protein